MLRSALPRFSAFLCLSLFAAFPLEARIGESRSELESRLIRQSGRGLEVSDGDLESFHLGRSPAAGPVSALEGEKVDFVLYYKINDEVIPTSARLWRKDRNGRRTSNPEPKPDGWMLHVVYLNGVSVLEYYQRSKSLTSVEREGLLARNQGNSGWARGKPPSDDDGVLVPKVFPVNHYRKDFAVYGNLRGDNVLFFDPRLDALVHEKQIEAAEEEAPASLDGF